MADILAWIGAGLAVGVMLIALGNLLDEWVEARATRTTRKSRDRGGRA